MKKADLHIHSTVSDGSDSIEEIIAKAEKKGLDAIAITDHDTLSHANQIPQSTNIKVIAGIEISAYDFDTNTRAHILGYNIKNSQLVTDFVQLLLEKRNENSLKQIDILNKNGFNIDLNKIRKADGKYIYKQHIMNYLVQTGKTPDMFGTFYMNTFKNNGICHFDIEYLDVFDAVKVIKSAGGLAVLAHSGQQENYYLIDKLIDLGLDGLEYNHHDNDTNAKEIIKKYAEKYNLFLTGGSDYHGQFDTVNVDIGDYLSEESGYDAVVK